MSAVSQDAIAVPQGERVVYEIDEAWPPTGRRRGWLMRRLLLAADVVGLVVAYFDRARARASGVDGRPRRACLGDRALRRNAPALGAARADLRALRSRRGANRSLDRRRRRRRLSGRHARDVELPRHHARRRTCRIRTSVDSSCSGFLPSLLIPLLRAVSRAIGRRQGAYVQNVIIVGSGSVAHLLADKIEKHPEYGLRVVGFVDHDDRAFASNGNGSERRLVGTTRRSAETRSRARGSPRGHRVLYRFARPDARRDSLDAGQRRADRHRPAHVRGARNERAAAHDRGDAARRTPEPAPLRVVAVPQAIVGRLAQRRSGSCCSLRSSSSLRC